MSQNRPNGLPMPYAHLPNQPRREMRQPMRTSKLGSKLKVLPTQPDTYAIPEEDEDEDRLEPEDLHDGEGVEFYTPLSQIPAGTARRDAQKLTKTEKAKLPRVTAFCTAASYNLPAIHAHLSARPASYRTHPRVFDAECLHTPYLPPPSGSSTFRGNINGAESPVIKPSYREEHHVPEGDLLNLNDDGEGHESGVISVGGWKNGAQSKKKEGRRKTGFSKGPGGSRRRKSVQRVDSAESEEALVEGYEGGDVVDLTNRDGEAGDDDESDDEWEEEEWVPDVFLFEYGTVVIWGMTEKEEKSFLRSLKKFEVERLNSEDVEMEDLNFYYADYSRIYNDVITLRKGSSYMTKLALSHALSQSVKISLFEELISSTIEQTKDIPKSMSETGKIGLPRSEIMKQIGNLFILRININLVGSILDSPEFFWTFPDLEPLYAAARSYLEISQRIDLLNARVDVLQDMLKLLKESVNSSHGERLEAIVIILIALEIVLGIITILVDLSLS